MNLTINNLSKDYGRGTWGLKHFTISLRPGILGLLGPNGAGKSTLMKILATVARPTSGEVTWNGGNIARSPNTVRKILGYLPQDFGVYPHLTAMEFLTYLAAAKGLDAGRARQRIDEMLQLVNLADVCHRPLGGFSGGMRQRVGIAQALLNDPELLIVDEPTAGLDPEERVRFRNLLSEILGERIVLLSTHIVSDVESSATEIAVLRRGELVAHCTAEAMIRSVEGMVWEYCAPAEALPALKNRWVVSSTLRRTGGVQVRLIAPLKPDPEAVPVPPSLEDAYLHIITGKSSQF